MKRASQPTLSNQFVDRDDESGIRPRAHSLVSEAIATGGMASVHLVAGGAEGQVFALKRLHPHLGTEDAPGQPSGTMQAKVEHLDLG